MQSRYIILIDLYSYIVRENRNAFIVSKNDGPSIIYFVNSVQFFHVVTLAPSERGPLALYYLPLCSF